MSTKLTIKLDKNIIERAKKYAADNNMSISKLVENYLDYLTLNLSDELEISPFVKSISTGKSITVHAEKNSFKEEYFNYLGKKHQ